MESALVFCISNEVWPNDKLCSADVLLASLKVCVELDVRHSFQPPTDMNTQQSPVAPVWMLSYSPCTHFPPFLRFVCGAFQKDVGNVNAQMFHFVISFIFKNLCTMFSKKGLQVLDKKGEQVHPCAILSRCCSVVFPASAVPDKRSKPFLSGSVADEPGSRLDVVCTAGMLVFKQLARLVIAAGEEGFTELRVARSCVGRTNLNSQVR